MRRFDAWGEGRATARLTSAAVFSRPRGCPAHLCPQQLEFAVPARDRGRGCWRTLILAAQSCEEEAPYHERSIRGWLPMRRGALRGHWSTERGGVVPLPKLSEA